MVKFEFDQINRRMMNGIEKEIRYLPWVVAFCTEQYLVVGTGSIVSEKWVLTAGHLWDEVKNKKKYVEVTKNNTLIKYGATVINEMDGADARINDIFVHPFYLDPEISQKAQYDSAMVRVEGQLMLKPGFAEAKPLADDSESYAPGEVCVLAGFGDTGDPATNAQPHHLSFLPVPIIKRNVCKKQVWNLPSNVICAGILSIVASGCLGDSGAPLTCRGRVYGIYIRGPDCNAGDPRLGIFAFTKTVSSFIREVMQYE